MNRILAAFVVLVVTALNVNALLAVEPAEWSFVWVSSGADWYVVKGVATVRRSGRNFVAEATGENTVKYRIVGKIDGRSIQARFSNLESDFFVNAPFSGTYTKRKDKGVNPCGVELIALHDGFNFIGLRRNFNEPGCGP